MVDCKKKKNKRTELAIHWFCLSEECCFCQRHDINKTQKQVTLAKENVNIDYTLI
jgi:hypothetical protein